MTRTPLELEGLSYVLFHQETESPLEALATIPPSQNVLHHCNYCYYYLDTAGRESLYNHFSHPPIPPFFRLQGKHVHLLAYPLPSLHAYRLAIGSRRLVDAVRGLAIVCAPKLISLLTRDNPLDIPLKSRSQ